MRCGEAGVTEWNRGEFGEEERRDFLGFGGFWWLVQRLLGGAWWQLRGWGELTMEGTASERSVQQGHWEEGFQKGEVVERWDWKGFGFLDATLFV